MPTIREAIVLSSAFQIPLGSLPVSTSVQDGELLFLASGNRVMVVDMTTTALPFKLLELPPSFKIVKMIANHSQELLALVGKKSVVVISLRQIPFLDPNRAWKPLKFVIDNFDSDVLSVAWHPASFTSTVIVVLTKTKLQSYDVLSSVTNATYDKTFSELELEISSMAFGSQESLSGSLTLFASTPSGEIYSLFPFMQQECPLRASRLKVDAFVAETQELVNCVELKFPPKITAGHPLVNNLLAQVCLARDLQQQINSPLVRTIDPNKPIRIVLPACDAVCSTVLARVEEGSKLLLLKTSTPTSLLLAYNDTASHISLTYLSQFAPQTMVPYYEVPRPEVTKAAQILAQKLAPEEKYHKPLRGFGFVVDSDSDNEIESKPSEPAQSHSDAYEVYELKVKCAKYIELSTNKLTTLYLEKYKKPSSSPLLIKGGREGWVLIGVGERVHAIEFNDWLLDLDDGFSVRLKQFNVTRRTMKFDEPISSFELLEDKVGNMGLHVLARAHGSHTFVNQIDSVVPLHLSNDKTAEPQASLSVSQPEQEVGISKADLDKFLQIKKAPPATFQSETRHAEDLIALINISDEIRAQSHQLSKFIIALNGKLEIQRQRNTLHGSLASRCDAADDINERTSEYDERITKLLTRQKDLLDRAESLETTIMKRFDEIKCSRVLPLSQAELLWFRELNLITELVTKDKTYGKSITTQANDISEKLSKIQRNWKKASYTDEIENGVKSLLLNSSLANIYRQLIGQGQTIGVTKGAIEAISKNVETILGV